MDLPQPDMLSLIEQRILGVLIEKQKTTADAYPMTLNALVTGSNQKSNRDPILNLNNDQVEETLEELNRRTLVVRVQSGRVDKWKHVLYESWKVEKVELAILAELFMRGAQTEGELRTRISRMDPVGDLDEVRGMVKRLSERKFVVYLTPEGRRGTVVTHGCQPAGAIERQRAGVRFDDRPDSPAPAIATTVPDTGREEIAELRKEMAELRLTLDTMAGQLRSLREQLGLESPPPA